MSGARAAEALEARFDGIVREELVRLQKKLARLEPPQRTAVERVTLDVVRAIALRPARALGPDAEPALVHALVHLFGMPDSDDSPAR
jgi:hypothetical protein